MIAGLLAAGLLLQPVMQENGARVQLLGLTLPTLCWFRLMTGHPCAGCGLTRSVVFLLHGDLAASFAIHPFGPVALALALLQAPPRVATALGRAGGWVRRWDQVWGVTLASAAVLMLFWWTARVGIGALLRAWVR